MIIGLKSQSIIIYFMCYLGSKSPCLNLSRLNYYNSKCYKLFSNKNHTLEKVNIKLFKYLNEIRPNLTQPRGVLTLSTYCSQPTSKLFVVMRWILLFTYFITGHFLLSNFCLAKGWANHGPGAI